MTNQPPVNNFPIVEGDLNVPYQVIGQVQARIGSRTAFSAHKEHDDVNPKLAAEAAKLGANAVIHVTYERGMSMTSYKALTAKGVAVFADFSQASATPSVPPVPAQPSLADSPSAVPPPQPPTFNETPPAPALVAPQVQGQAFAPPAGSSPLSPPPAAPQGAGSEAKVGSDKSTIALICGIAGIICCAPLAIFAFIMGGNARKVAQETGRPLDSNMQVAWVLGIVGLALWALIILANIVLFAVGGDTSTTP